MTSRPPEAIAHQSPHLDAAAIASTYGGQVCDLTIVWEIVDDEFTTGQLLTAGRIRLAAYAERHGLLVVADSWTFDPDGTQLLVGASVVAWPAEDWPGWDGSLITGVDEAAA